MKAAWIWKSKNGANQKLLTLFFELMIYIFLPKNVKMISLVTIIHCVVPHMTPIKVYHNWILMFALALFRLGETGFIFIFLITSGEEKTPVLKFWVRFACNLEFHLYNIIISDPFQFIYDETRNTCGLRSGLAFRKLAFCVYLLKYNKSMICALFN